MKKHKKVILVITAIVILIIVGIVIGANLLTSQYNKNGISRLINISINEEIGMEYIGESEGYKVYTDQLEDTYCMDVKGKKHLLSEVLEEKKITITDMIKGLQKVKNTNTKTQTIYKAENYQIILEDGTCIIAPLESDIE